MQQSTKMRWNRAKRSAEECALIDLFDHAMDDPDANEMLFRLFKVLNESETYVMQRRVFRRMTLYDISAEAFYCPEWAAQFQKRAFRKMICEWDRIRGIPS